MKDPERLEYLAQIAGWYYEDDLTQGEIAKRINLSRSMVSRLLRESREEGLVEIRVKHVIGTDAMLEERLLETFGLSQARVLAEPPREHESLLRRLGELGARLFQQRVHGNIRVGIGWGTALHAMTRSMPYMPLQNATVIQIIGAIGHGDPMVDGLELARWLAQKLEATPRLLYAPVLVDSEEVAQTFLRERTIAETLALVPTLEIALIGIGTLDPEFSSLRRSGFLDRDELEALESAGAAGDILGYQIDALGMPLDVPLNRRIVGTTLDLLREVPLVMAVAGGEVKAPAILAALRGGFVDALVTDARAARQVLALHAQQR